MAKYFVYENKHYPGPGARERFEVRQFGFIDRTVEFCSTKEAAEKLCAQLTGQADFNDQELRGVDRRDV